MLNLNKSLNVKSRFLSGKKIIVRNRSRESLCENCIRVTVGTPMENMTLIEALKNYKND